MGRILFCIFVALSFVLPSLAGAEQDKSSMVVTASYVQGAYDTIDVAKQDKLTSTNVVESGSGPVVQSVTASNGTVVVSKGEITIPSGTESGPSSGGTRVEIWFE